MWDNLFNNTFREGANKDLPQLDKSAMWSSLEKDLDKRSRNKGFAWFFFIGGLFIASVLGVYISKNHQSFVSEKFVDNSLKDKASTKNQTKPKAQVSTLSNEAIAETAKIQSTVLEDDLKSTIANKDQSIQSELPNQGDGTLATNNLSTIKSNLKTSNLSNLNELDLKSNEAKSSTFVTQIERKIEISESAPSESTSIEQIIGKNERTYSMVSSLPTTVPLALIANFEFNTLSQNLPIEVLSNPIKRWTIFGSAGFVFFDKNVTSVNPELKEFAQFKNDSEVAVAGVSSKLLVGYKIKSNIQLRAGLQYLSLFETFDYNRTTSEEISAFSEDAYEYVRSDGTRQTFSGDVLAAIETNRRIVHNNNHNIWNFMMEAGFSKKMGKINAELKTGLSATLSHTFNGKSIDRELNPINLNKDKNLYDKFSGFWHAGFAVELPLSRRMSLRSDFNYNLGLGSVNKNILDYKQTYKYYDGNIGLSYSF